MVSIDEVVSRNMVIFHHTLFPNFRKASFRRVDDPKIRVPLVFSYRRDGLIETVFHDMYCPNAGVKKDAMYYFRRNYHLTRAGILELSVDVESNRVSNATMVSFWLYNKLSARSDLRGRNYIRLALSEGKHVRLEVLDRSFERLCDRYIGRRVMDL